MDIKEFSKINKEMWKDFQNHDIKANMLVESPYNGAWFITHCLAMQSLILNKAKGYRPLFLYNADLPVELLQSYVPEAKYVKLEGLNIFDIIFIAISSVIAYLIMVISGSTINFRFKGVYYGDIVHDVFLSTYEQGTLQKPDYKIIKTIIKVMKKHIRYQKTIRKNKVKAVLASHRIGINAGCLVRCGLKNKCKAYTSAGMHRNTLYLSNNLKEMKDYEYTPSREEMQGILAMDNEMFDNEYERIRNIHLYNDASNDVKYAYSSENKLYKSREEFNQKFNLDSSKKNVFVMLHAFTDHPHSHFLHMVFKDYGDWFLKTLDYAKTHDHVNWIFKQHPSDRFYPTKDINFTELFKDAPSNIVFLSCDDKVDTRSLEHTADAVITCLGFAGFEMPAFYGIPAFTAGDNHYIGYSFSYNSKNKKDYFATLDNMDKVQKISPEQQREAKAMYMYTYGYCTVDYSFIPVLSFDDHHDSELDKKLWGKIAQIYAEKKDLIQNQVARYAFEASRRDFKALRGKSYKKYEDYFSFPFNITKPMPECKIDIMKEGCQILKDLNIPYCLADGTLLGVYRDNRLIPHDTDIDISIISPVDKDSIIREFTRHGFNIGRLPISYGEIQQVVFYKNETLFDIIFYEKVGSKVLNFCERDFYFEHDAKYYENYQPFMFEGFEFSIPNDTEGWLAHTYGDDWRQPKPKPKDWREGNSYLGAFSYNGDRRTIENKFNKELLSL